jgi:hypothetical protein
MEPKHLLTFLQESNTGISLEPFKSNPIFIIYQNYFEELLGIVFLVIRTLSDSWVANQPSFHFF